MPSANYQLFARALRERRPLACLYGGYRRVLCPVILGHTGDEEMALTYQFAGDSSSGLPRGGQWKCLRLARVENPQLQDGPWRTGASHGRPQACVETVDLDANPDSPYLPAGR